MTGFQIDPTALAKIRNAAQSAVKDAAEFTLETANRTIPIDTGALQRSGQVSTSTDGLTAAISYDTPYAARVHEDTRAQRRNGRKAKWLEHTVDAEATTIFKFIGDRLKAAFS